MCNQAESLAKTYNVLPRSHASLLAWAALQHVCILFCVGTVVAVQARLTDAPALQRFIQRLQNYIVYVLTRATIIRGKVADERNFAKKIGQEAPSFAASSAALIVTTDWAIEFAQPVPPRVHVRFLSCAAAYLIDPCFEL